MKVNICILMLLTLGYNITNAQSTEFGWLKGTWKLKDKNVYEVWKVGSDGKTLEGTSFRLANNDTLITEEIKLVHKDGSFHYVPDVAGDQPAIDFTITSHTSDSFVAENAAHDFPKLIRYKMINLNEQQLIEAAIEGNGKVIPYTFHRLK